MRWFTFILEAMLQMLKRPARPNSPSLPEAASLAPEESVRVPGESEGVSDKLTANFELSEFRCRDGSEVPKELLENVQLLADNLQVLRDHLGKPIRVISGYRSPQYNRKIGGARRSQHMLAKAADVKISGMTPGEIKRIIEDLISLGRMHPGGIGLYKTFTHYDVRGRNARWHGKGTKDDTP